MIGSTDPSPEELEETISEVPGEQEKYDTIAEEEEDTPSEETEQAVEDAKDDGADEPN